MVKLKYIALPNILADKEIAPEFIQDDVPVARLTDELRSLAGDDARREEICASFEELHGSLKKNASSAAADAVAELIAPND